MPRRQFLSAIAFFACSLPGAVSSEDIAVLVIPGLDVNLNVPLVAQTTDVEIWAQTVLGNSTTSDQALSVWCSVISTETPAIVLSTSLLEESEIDHCQGAQSQNVMAIELTPSLLGPSSAVLSNGDSNAIYLYLRSGDQGFVDLSGIGKGILYPSFGELIPEVFQSGRQGGNEDEFFPNFCQMCSCCTEVRE
jgi:hypothetical protein